MPAVIAIVAFAISLSPAAAMRSKLDAEAALRLATNVSDGPRWSECPDKCSQCCTMKWGDYTVAGLFGMVSGEKYKCILKDSSDRPEGCDPAETRTHSTGQSKTKCKFSAAQIKAKAWEELEKTPCSKMTSCCCDTADDWTEKICLDGPGDQVQATTKHEKAPGTTQTYLKSPSQTYTNKGACERGEVALGFSDAPPFRQDSEISGKDRKWKETIEIKGCCLETGRETRRVKHGCYKQYSDCFGHASDCIGGCTPIDAQSGMGWCHKWKCSYTTFSWTVCKGWQKLFKCGGAKRSGYMYDRISSTSGKCVPDDSCPKGFSETVAGRSCKCDVGCGTRSATWK